MLLIAREIVRKNLFPRLTQALSAAIVQHMIDRLFWLALAAVIVGGIVFVAPTLLHGSTKQASLETRFRAQIPLGQPAHDFGENGIKVKYYENLGSEGRYVLVLPNGSLVRNIASEGHRHEFHDQNTRYSFRVNSVWGNGMDVTLVKNPSQ